MSRHPLSPEQVSEQLGKAFIGDLPEGISQVTSHVTASHRFHLTVSDQVHLSGSFEVKLFGQIWDERPSYSPAADFNSVHMHAGLGTDLYDHEVVTLHIPEWAELNGARRPSPDELTLALSADGTNPDTCFPADEKEVFRLNEKEGLGGGIEALNAKERAGIEWALDKVRDGRVQLDLDDIRIAAGSEIYDGHGTLMACHMRLAQGDLEAFADRHGEAELRRAYAEGHLFSNPGTADAPVSDRRLDRICERLMGHREKGHMSAPYVRWDRTAFETVIRPLTSGAPFDGSPCTRETPLAFLEARMGLVDPSPEPELS